MRSNPTVSYLSALLLLTALALHCPALAGDARDPLGQALGQATLFAGLSNVQLEALEPAAALRQGKAGDLLIRQGSVMGQILIVLDGEVDVRIDKKSFVLLSGQILLGEIEFLDGLPATADVVLLKDADYLSLDNNRLNRIMTDHPDIGYTVIREIARIEAQRLRKTSTK